MAAERNLSFAIVLDEVPESLFPCILVLVVWKCSIVSAVNLLHFTHRDGVIVVEGDDLVQLGPLHGRLRGLVLLLCPGAGVRYLACQAHH